MVLESLLLTVLAVIIFGDGNGISWKYWRVDPLYWDRHSTCEISFNISFSKDVDYIILRCILQVNSFYYDNFTIFTSEQRCIPYPYSFP